MADTLLPLDPQTPAAEIAAKFDKGEEAEALLRDDLTADQYFRLLQKDRLYFDCIRMLALVLHKYFAVQWAADACRSELNEQIEENDLPILDVVDAWLADPTEATRRAAMKAAEDGGYATAACWAAAGAGWSGGSLAPVGLPVVPPAENLTAKAVSGAISLVAVQNSAQIEKRAAKLVDMALELAKQPAPPPLYGEAEAEAAPAAEPEAPAEEAPKPVVRPVAPKPAVPRKPEQQTAFKGLKPTAPKIVPPVKRPAAPRKPEPPPTPPSGPGTWSTDPL